MEHPFITLFEPVLAIGTKEDAVSYLLQHPVLTSSYYTGLLQHWAETLAPADRQRAEWAIALKLDLFQQMKARKIRIEPPLPVLDLAGNVAKGVFTLQYAEQAASRPELFVELMYPSITLTCEVAEQGMLRDWRPAVTIMRILFAALDARRKVIPENQDAMEMTSIASWLIVAQVACTDVPDGRIFRDAVTRAEAVASLDDLNPPTILHRLGTLHLDPYVAGRSSGNLDQQDTAWRYRLFEEYGDQLAGVPAGELNMPPASESLPKAAQYFRRAAACRTGEARGQTLKALAQTLVWHEFYNLPFDPKECSSAAREALSLLPLERFPSEHAELNRTIAKFEKSSPASTADAIARAQEVLDMPVGKWVEQKGEIPTIDIFHENAFAVADADPGLALKLWMAVDGIVRSRPEARRKEHDKELVKFAYRALAPHAPEADGTPVERKLQSLVDSANLGAWPIQKVVYNLLRLAASTTTTSQEGEGLEVLVYCSNLARQCPDPILERALPILRAVLQTGHAVNAFDAHQFGVAARLYALSIARNLEAGQPLAALDIIRRLLDLAAPGRPEYSSALDALVAGLGENALALELGAGNAATSLIQFACRYAISTLMSSGRAKTTEILFVLDIAKGRRFRSALARPDAVLPWLNDPRVLAMETDILRLRSLAMIETPGKTSAIDENMLLTAYVSPSEQNGGATAGEQLRNLQIRFDTGLDRQVSVADDDWLPTIEKVQSLLDDKVVLLIQHIGTNPQGLLTVRTVLLSKDDSGGGQAVFPDTPTGDVQMSEGDETITGNLLSSSVGQLRNWIISPPGERVADSRALDALSAGCAVYLGGPIQAKLDQLRAAGKDHICVSAHGPLHFYPFHLLGAEDQPLASDWCVTYLPHLRLLDRRTASGPGKLELTSIGLNFAADNAFHLGALTRCEEEAQGIAAVYAPRAKLITGRDATEKAVREALTGSRRVHISTHGQHNVSAPSFQHVFVQPDQEDDGIIHAYEMRRLDLRGLDLVTFSACETALGRFDVGDNLRGIPATLLIAGVSTIVGTLWNVESEAAIRFFTAFYRILKEKGSKKAAFYEAQQETRREFPAYRDWGAFQLIGSWY